ncbi:serine hydrolase domain-containing protein [Micromonospora purpureochromogenes]
MSTVPQIRGSMLAVAGDTTIAEVISDDCTPRTRFQIASLSKQFTAAAVLLLAERGALRLDDPIGRWIGGCPPSWHDITLHHLLSHTSGLGHWHDYPMIDLARRVEPADLLETFYSVAPLFPPGERWHYSSPGYVLLAHVAQRAADEQFRDLLTRTVFAPLQMEDTFAGSPADRADVARGHDRDGRPVPSWELDVLGMGTGDIWSTARDLLAWIDGLRAGRLLGERYRKLMLTEQARTGGREDAGGYGYGWFLGSWEGRTWFHHSGENAGFRAFDACLPDTNHRVLVLSNCEATSPAVVTDLLAVALG